eukprot:527091-Prorocentrum_minimum.AAC.2
MCGGLMVTRRGMIHGGQEEVGVLVRVFGVVSTGAAGGGVATRAHRVLRFRGQRPHARCRPLAPGACWRGVGGG